ncbi:hypothetical protein [Sphingomonas sp. PP-CC-3G-468]|uniref:hypothetical protein n=1 Tax=Sphingomonas sp. PP-CC-3G-468 TaxID=2135656 RepID=UPI001047F58B|nr:hypothetical protein [Sphingomonas sp. PP-CC-3G-468]
MNTKSEFIDYVEDSLSVLGYRQVSRGVFRKPSDDFEYQVGLSFAGKVALTCNIYFGFWIESVEVQAGNHSSVQLQRVSGARNVATVFGTLDIIGKWSDIDVGYLIDLDRDWSEQMAKPFRAVPSIERKVRSLNDVAILATSLLSLPLGHHAFRVPILLKNMNNDKLFDEYTEYVKSTGFIQGYVDFLERL